MTQENLFFLPLLVEKDLIKDDSKHYALLTYNKPVMTQACKLIVKSIGESVLPFDSKKRVKFIMEFLAVALGMPIAEHELMAISVSRYREWLIDSSVFGDNARQNKYIRRIITQLTTPFAFNQPKDEEHFKRFEIVLKDILTIFDDFHKTRGPELEKETWLILFNSMIGICDSILHFQFDKVLRKEEASVLRQMAIDLLISVLHHSGIKDEPVWTRFSAFCREWSWNLDFVQVWGRRVIELFDFINSRIYGLECKKNLFEAGVYGPSKVIQNDMISFVFHGTIFALDCNRMVEDPQLMLSLAGSLSQLMQAAKDVASSTSALFLNRFPAISFLRLFGQFLTFAPVMDERFDQAVSINIDTILQVISKFDSEGAEEEMTRLVAYLLKRIDPSHPRNLASFFNRVPSAFAFNTVFLPYISEVVLQYIPSFHVVTSFTKLEFFEHLSSLFVTAAEVLKNTVDAKKKIETAFNAVWNIAQMPATRYMLLCAVQQFDLPIYQKIADVFDEAKIRYLVSSEVGINYIIGCIDYVGAIVRANPSSVDNLNTYKMFPLIVDSVQKIDTNPRIIVAVLLLVQSLIEWGGSCLQTEENTTAFIKFVDWLTPIIQHKSATWSEANKKIIQALFAHVTARINVHMPQNDYFTKKLDSSAEINEALVIQSLNIQNPKIYHYTVGDQLLVSFIEQDTGADPLIVFARGSFGKSIWTVADDYQGKLPTPKLSTAIEKVDLPEPTPIQVEPLQLRGDPIKDAPTISMAELQAEDDNLRKVSGKDFSTWLNWDNYGFYTPFDQKSAYQRPRVVDFLTTMGILDNHNNLSVRVQNDKEAVERVIKEFDALEVTQVSPIVITHLLSDDETVDYSANHHNRMTQLLQQFMREIAEPMTVTDTAAKSHGLPEFRTTVPMIYTVNSFGAVICPAMAKTENGAKQIADLSKTALIRIIFDETGFEVVPSYIASDTQFVFVVRPTLKGLYHVWQVSKLPDVVSPFGEEQTMSAQSIGFNISLLLELCTCIQSEEFTPNVAEKRQKLIAELCQTPVVAELGALAATAFTAH